MSDAPQEALSGPPGPPHPPTPPPPRYFPGGERVAFFTVLVFVLGATAYMLWPIAVGPLIALAMGSLIHGPAQRVARRIGPRLSSTLFTIGLVLVVLVPLATLLTFIARSLVVEVASLSGRISELPALVERLAARVGPLGPPLQRAAESATRDLADALPAVAQRAGSFAGIIGGALVQFGIGLLLFCLTLYYFLVEGQAWRDRFVRLLPIRAERTHEFMKHFREVSLAVLVGGLGTTAIQALVAGLGYWMLGVDAPLFWALVTGVAALVPAVGTGLVLIPLALAKGLGGDWLRGGLLLGYGVVVVGLVDNVARPVLVRAGMQMHPLLVFFAMFGGLASFGVAGIFVGPLLMATALAALRMYETVPATA